MEKHMDVWGESDHNSVNVPWIAWLLKEIIKMRNVTIETVHKLCYAVLWSASWEFIHSFLGFSPALRACVYAHIQEHKLLSFIAFCVTFFEVLRK